MKYNIDLREIIPHGKVDLEYIDNNLNVKTNIQNDQFSAKGMPINSYIRVPEKLKLPVQIDIRAKIDVPSMYLILGKGHITFGTLFIDNRRLGDIIEPDPKKVCAFDNKVDLNVFFDCTVIYDLKFMQILINGKEKYYSKNEKYMKSLSLSEINTKGFELKVAGSKNTCLTIASLIVTEFKEDELAYLRSRPNTEKNQGVYLAIDKKAKPNFDECISMLSKELKNEIISLNDFLLTNKNLRIKRKIEGTCHACKINYVSTHGFSYAIRVSENILDHFFWWYMVSNKRYENKFMGRKNDLTKETLNKLAEISHDSAKNIFSYYKECGNCGENCAVKTIYEYKGVKKVVCHGKMIMNMNIETFKNIKIMFDILDNILMSKNM